MKILNSIFRWIKQQFCKHDYNITEYIPTGKKRTTYMFHCKKCGQTII